MIGYLKLFVPVPGLSRNMLLVTELRGEGILSPRQKKIDGWTDTDIGKQKRLCCGLFQENIW